MVIGDLLQSCNRKRHALPFLCTKPSELRNLFNTIKDDYIVSEECPYGDGHSSDKIVEILKCVV